MIPPVYGSDALIGARLSRCHTLTQTNHAEHPAAIGKHFAIPEACTRMEGLELRAFCLTEP